MADQYLEALRSTQEFQELLGRVKAHRPTVPAHNPDKDNTEDWKARSAMKQGFDLCLTLFGERTHD